ncbi:hypothetical protein F183_A25520 [Bryobacterales bacterium F-183]|nr:hypothetical protein F183_A25520 [Bryobacterales bacterium F-183]
MNTFSHYILTALILSAGTALADPIIGVTATSATTVCCSTSYSDIVNGRGLTSYTTAGIHDSRTDAILNSRTGNIDFDLHGTYWVGSIAVWNGSFGVKEFSLLYSTDGATFTPVSTGPHLLSLISLPTNTTAEVFNFAPVQATHMRMAILSGYSITNNTTLKEVMFVSTAAPPPSTLPEGGGSVALLSTAVLLAWRRVKR